MNASALYRSELWRAGMLAARALPRPALEAAAQRLAAGYGAFNARRREAVIQNLLPPHQFDRAAAERTCRDLFRQFGLKLADLWRYESGLNTPLPSFHQNQWDEVERARARGRGLLLLTPHLGNWELGAPFLRQRGVLLQVITQAEPQDSLTQLRKGSRARAGIETLVIGENPFAFLEVIRQLERGAVIALLVDRPPARTSVTVKLFGHRFAASIAPAELARASGCALLPAAILRTAAGYSLQLLPEIPYDRTKLGTREARANFTQQMMKIFEPIIRENLDQWFHFVPIWSKEQPDS